jgi:isoaspartyl peptidase/L-asparaginase-like protein (Ntn-hydrolase superfamily)
MGRAANEVAWERMTVDGGTPLDACEAGVRVTEADPSVHSVGYGGRPNAAGVVQLDSSIMRGDTLECGSVAALENVLHPVSVARAVMERTPHVLLVGDGALEFARSIGVLEQDMLTDDARQAWEAWKAEQDAPREPVEDDHDTIGMIALDGGRFAMAVTTSGWAYKLPGRVGDSPIIGAGGYCDDEVGACVATGDGEEMIRTCASFAVVEAMRRGIDPGEACAEVLRRIDKKAGSRNPSVALLAVDRHGRVGARSLRADFDYALSDDEVGTVVLPAEKLT